MVRGRIGAGAIGLLLVLGAACSSSDDTATDVPAAGETTTSTASSAAEAASGELTLLSYNVAGLPKEVSDVDPDIHIPMISSLLEPFDLVLTQEDFDWWQPSLEGLDFVNYHTRLRADTTHPYVTERHPGPEAVGLGDWEASRPTLLVGDGLGMLSRYPMTNIVRVPWAGCFGGADTSDGGAGDCLSMKGFAVATVELAPGVAVDVYNLHGEAGGSESDQALQAEMMVQLAEFMADHSEGKAVILAGDTNLHTNTTHRDASGTADLEIWDGFLAATGLADVCREVTCDEEPESIDKAAVRSGGGVTLEAVSRTMPRATFTSPDGVDLSDHPPVVVTVRWSTT